MLFSMSATAISLTRFAPATQRWFKTTFAAPTPVQLAAWDAIASGKHALVIAPTGSGKTLAAFLHAIDALFREREQQDSPDRATRTRILYISPVKALAADVQRNLRLPLEGVCQQRRQGGEPAITLTVGMRSGDTTRAERAALQRTPPDILITTPESLFLMLTSRAREALRGVTTLILDEVHAVAGSKRGSQLALSLERLDCLLPQPAQRIGLSATVRPVERVAQFLGGVQETVIVNPAAHRALAMQVSVPVEDMTDIASSDNSGASGSIWPHIEQRILEAVLARRTTLIFVNSRGLAEKLTARLNERYAADFNTEWKAAEPAQAFGSFSGGTTRRSEDVPLALARSHHGSVSKEQRREIEDALKSGALRCVVATSSLELGIDMGTVDLVIQVGAPLSVASALQRVGRASHQVGGISSGIVFPRTRRDLIDAAVTVQCMLNGELEPVAPPHNPLDVLAQQTVAAVAMEPLSVETWFATVRRADPFRTLPRSLFDATLDMLAGKYPADDFAQLRPRLIWDREANLLSARPGAQHLAVTSGGTIPDRGSFSVMLPEGEEQAGSRRVGELDEEMVYESRVNDIITLGATSWRIQQITHDQVVVVPAPGRSARLPFWRGEGLGRSALLGERIGRFLREAEAESVQDPHWMDSNAQHNIRTLLVEQREATGRVPTDRTLLIERCRDENGDWRVILHSPWGQRVHAPWALAVAERIRRRMGLEPAIVASDDGIVARFPDTEGRVPGAELFQFDADTLQRVVIEATAQSALFAARFRECAARALLLPRRTPGKRSPLWQQRLRAGELLAVARDYPDFPILIETARECLQDVYDLPALHQLMQRIQHGSVQFAEVTTEVPSPLAAPLLFGYVAEFIYATDAPQAERRASLLALDSGLLSELLGQVNMRDLLDADVVFQVGEELQRRAPRYQIGDKEGVADLLRETGPLSTEALAARFRGDAHAAALALAQAHRVINVTLAGEQRWAAIEDAARLRDGLGVALPDSIPAAFLQPVADPLRDLLSRYARTHTPFTTDQIARHFGLGPAVVSAGLERLREQGKLLKGDFGLSVAGDASMWHAQWVSEEVFKRLRIHSLQAAREATKPVPPQAWVSLLLERQGVIGEAAQGSYEGVDGVARVIEQLAGLALPASIWQTQIFPARVYDYQPAMLDELLSAGEALWAGERALGHNDGLVSLHLRDYVAETLLPLSSGSEALRLTPLHETLLALLDRGGAWFAHQIAASVSERLPEVDEAQIHTALWELAWAGYVTSDTWAALRQLTSMTHSARARPTRSLRTRRGRVSLTLGRTVTPALPGRWSRLTRSGVPSAQLALSIAENMLDRWGVVTRSAAIAEQVPGGFPALQPVMRGLEDAGRVLRGRFISGLGGAQFAEQATIERLRILAERTGQDPQAVALSAIDPANPFGQTLRWPAHPATTRPARRSGALIVICHGQLALYLAQGGKELLSYGEADWQRGAVAALAGALRRERASGFTLETIDGKPAGQSPLIDALRRVGFSREPKGYSWYG
ncbi:ATP-dependent helicase [Candidatus Pantoea deserta]|uniref:ATP-dependent helicase n=2 Tax=Candidatus Pantoea deserta TaxID=1869313 RepID=A0A3N4NKY5_9GAMM|nr:ATP-dependent helicase [Pantoea deserta]RPD96881.1 ATP-dependent helicase [Pantoea deserta]